MCDCMSGTQESDREVKWSECDDDYLRERHPIPADLYDEKQDCIANSHVLHGSDAFRRSMEVRLACQRVCIEDRDDAALRMALDARPRPYREYCVGDCVAYWRKRGNLKKDKAKWHGRAIVIGREKQNVWTAHGQTCLHCAPEHLRSFSRLDLFVQICCRY